MPGNPSLNPSEHAEHAPLTQLRERDASTRRMLWLRALCATVFLTIVFAVWHFTGLGELDSAEKLAAAVRDLRSLRFAMLYVVVAFVLGTMLLMPSSLLIAGTVLALGPAQGVPCAFAGALSGAALGYGLGRLLGHAPLSAFEGTRFQQLRKALTRRGFRTTVVARVMPVGNFTLINMLAGSMGVPFVSFMLGNLVGLSPWILGLGLFAGQVAVVFD